MCTKREGRACASGMALSFFAGAAAGLAIGLLCAPRAGRATRNAIRDTGREWYGRGFGFYENCRHIVDDAADLFERGRRMASGGF